MLRIVGFPRGSEEGKAEYKKRTVIERHFSSAKHSRLNQHRYQPVPDVAAVLMCAHYLATALAHLQADDYAHMRHMRIKLPSATHGISPDRACRDPRCTCCGRWPSCVMHSCLGHASRLWQLRAKFSNSVLAFHSRPFRRYSDTLWASARFTVRITRHARRYSCLTAGRSVHSDCAGQQNGPGGQTRPQLWGMSLRHRAQW